MEYIGRRPGVVLNESLKHGLFGIASGKKAEETANIQELSRQIEAKTREGAIAYRVVISFTEADAMRLGYDDPALWRELVRSRLPDMCEKIGIPIQNLEYTAAIHRDKGHPHCHILFWDKAQDVKREAFVPPETADAIRVGIIKAVFGEEIAVLQALKNEARKAALEKMGGFFADFAKAFADITPREYMEGLECLKCESDLAEGHLIYSRFNSAAMRELTAGFLKLAESVPAAGRLNFKLMPPETKDKIRVFIENVLSYNADCDREFKKYVRAAVQLSSYYSDKPETHDKAGRTAYDDMINRLGNAVLRAVKELNQQRRDETRDQKHESFQRQITESLVTEIFGILSRSASAEERKSSRVYRKIELSRQAKKELALRLENTSGYDWDQGY